MPKENPDFQIDPDNPDGLIDVAEEIADRELNPFFLRVWWQKLKHRAGVCGCPSCETEAKRAEDYYFDEVEINRDE